MLDYLRSSDLHNLHECLQPIFIIINLLLRFSFLASLIESASFTTILLKALLKPSKSNYGLDQGDGKRPDGLTLVPFSHGKSLVWDATCVDTFAATNILRSASEAGTAASKAEEAKACKYSGLTDRFMVQPIAVETAGVIGPSSLSFLREIGKRAATLRREPRETQWLLQRIGLAILRGNVTSIRLSG